MAQLTYYLTNFEFWPDEVVLGSSLQQRRLLWTLGMYVALSVGILARQVVSLSPLGVNFDRVTGAMVVGSTMVGLALLPPVMRVISKRAKRPSFEHVLAAYSVGFFIDLTLTLSVPKIVALVKSLVP